MKHISTISILTLCIYSAASCSEVTFTNGTDTFKRPVGTVDPEKTRYHSIIVLNKAVQTIEARVEGFGVKDTNSNLEPLKLNSGGVNIQPEGYYSFDIPMSSMQFPIKSTLYRLYAHALIIKYPNNNNSEIHVSNPLDQSPRNFMVKSYNNNQGSVLTIERL